MKTLFLEIDIKSLRWDFFRGSGKGGQKRNKTDNCARCTHEESNSQGKSESGRSKEQNKKKSIERLIEKSSFIDWAQQLLNKETKGLRIMEISICDDSIFIYDLGKYTPPKRKEVKRKPVPKDKVKEDRRESKKKLNKLT